MLEALLEMEIAVKIMNQDERKLAENKDKDPLDIHYESLHTNIRPVDPSSEEFKAIVKCLMTTHAPTHTEYTMQVQEVFAVQREGQVENFCEYLQRHPDVGSHRKFLWHGSRITNFIGILSQGLRIAPVSFHHSKL
jgi:hypothetical protein